MEIPELLAIHRDHYINIFKGFIQENKGNTFELLIETSDDFPFHRTDTIQLIEEDYVALDFEVNEFLDHELIESKLNNKRLLIDPFLWNDCEILLNQNLVSWQTVTDWAKRCMDVDELISPDENGLLNVIHGISYPMPKEDWISFSVDFGTVKSEEMMQLLEILTIDPNIETVMIGSPNYTGIG